MKRLVNLNDVELAARQGVDVIIDDQTIITPYAADRAKDLGVRFVKKKETESKGPDPTEVQEVKVVVLGADHGGFALKEELLAFVRSMGYSVIDVGTYSSQSCDYPDFAFKVADAVARGEAQCGIMIDSVGIGSAMAANRVAGVLAAKCNNTVEAQSAREHNYANVLTLGAKIIGENMAREIVRVFLTTPGGAERHRRRVKKILTYSNEH